MTCFSVNKEGFAKKALIWIMNYYLEMKATNLKKCFAIETIGY